jgi:hypothetical protein
VNSNTSLSQKEKEEKVKVIQNQFQQQATLIASKITQIQQQATVIYNNLMVLQNNTSSIPNQQTPQLQQSSVQLPSVQSFFSFFVCFY